VSEWLSGAELPAAGLNHSSIFLRMALRWIQCLWGCQRHIWRSVFTGLVLFKCWSGTSFHG